MTNKAKSKASQLPRREYIRLLAEYARDSKFTPTDDRDIILSLELIDEHYLSGRGIPVIPKPDQPSIHFINVRITVKGRLFLQQLLHEEAEASFIGRMKKRAEKGIGLIIGIIIGVSIPILSKMFQELVDLWKK